MQRLVNRAIGCCFCWLAISSISGVLLAAEVRGIVLDGGVQATKNRLGGVDVFFIDATNRSTVATALTDGNGEFKAEAPVGKYTVEYRLRGYLSYPHPQQCNIATDAILPSVTLWRKTRDKAYLRSTAESMVGRAKDSGDVSSTLNNEWRAFAQQPTYASSKVYVAQQMGEVFPETAEMVRDSREYHHADFEVVKRCEDIMAEALSGKANIPELKTLRDQIRNDRLIGDVILERLHNPELTEGERMTLYKTIGAALGEEGIKLIDHRNSRFRD